MKTNSKELEIFLGGIEEYYGRIYRLLKWLCIALVLPILGIMVWTNVQNAKMGNEDDYLIMKCLLLFTFIAVFGISFYSLKNSKRKRIRDFIYFIDNPDTLISYQIIAAEVTKLTLTGISHNATFSVGLSPLEVEELLFEIFPYLQKNKEHRESKSEATVINEFQPKPQKIDKSVLMQNIPSVLKKYFDEKYKPKLGCLPYIFVIILSCIIMSLIGRFGWYNFGIFEVGNSYWVYFTPLFLIFGIALFSGDSDGRKIHDLLKNPENVIWIYLKKTKDESILSFGSKTTIVIADVKKRHEVSLFNKDEEETLLWLSQYCPIAIVGFYYEWDKIYEKNPNEFLTLIRNNPGVRGNL